MRKILAPIAAVGLLLAMVGTVLAWVPPTLTSECAPDANHFAWKINLAAGEPDYNIDWSFDSGFAGATTVDFVSAGDHSFTTPRGGTTLYVRWSSDTNSKAQADANTVLCEQPTPTPTLTSECAPNDTSYAWKINLAAGEPDYNIDWSFDSGFATFTTVNFVNAGDHSFTTPRGGTTLYVRWSSDTNSKAEAAANPNLCVSAEQPTPTPTPTPTPEQTQLAATGTPAATIPNTSLEGNGSSPLPTVIFGMVLLASLTALAYTNVKTVKGTRTIR